MSHTSNWTSRVTLLMVLLAIGASMSCMQDGPTEIDHEGPRANRPNFSVSGGIQTVTATVANGVVVTLSAPVRSVYPSTTPKISWSYKPYKVWVHEAADSFWHFADIQVSVYNVLDRDGYRGLGWDGCTTGISDDSLWKSCNPGPYSQTVYLQGQVEGTPVSLQVHVDVINCLVDSLAPIDTLLNKESVRLALHMALDSSPTTGNPWNRRERGIYGAWQDSGFVRNFIMPIKDGIDTPCHFEFPDNPPLTGLPVYRLHSHPFVPGSTADPLPYNATATPRSNCAQVASEIIPSNKVPTARFGPSYADSLGVEWSIPELVVDPKTVYLMSRDSATNALRVRTIPRNGSCDPLNVN